MKWYRLLRKLGLHRVGTRLLMHAPGGKRETMTEAEARRILQAAYPRKESSCVLPAARNWPEASCDLTVIVPVYNNGEYIEESVRSVLSQKTEFGVEVIVVNDGSTDDTAERLKAFAGCPSVRVITRENGGVAVARNVALDQARGRYLMFLDGDDFLLPGAVQALMRCAEEHQAAIVEGGYNVISEDGKPIQSVPHREGPSAACQLTGFCCFKVYARKLWDRLMFPPHMHYEDSIIAQVLLERLDAARGRAWGIGRLVGAYRFNWKGFSQACKTQPCTVDAVFITDILMRDRETLGMPFSQGYYEHLLEMAALSWGRTEMLPRDVRRAVLVMYRHFLFDHPAALRTTRESQRPLEQALLAGVFWRYELICAWHE